MNDIVKIDSAAVLARLLRIGRELADTTPLMRGVGMELLALTEDNFAREGQPEWPVLSQSTIEQRTKTGTWPGKVLQISGALARGVTVRAGNGFVDIGVAGVPYAAIHQFGGKAGRGGLVAIPARPYMPILPNGELTPVAIESINDLLDDYVSDIMQV